METKKTKTKVLVSLVVLAGLLIMPLAGHAGNLEPSAGPGPTMKTLDEVEPRIPIQSLSGDTSYAYIINSSGSYYLTGDVIAIKGGIKVTADNVTIDLCGYSLSGTTSSSTYYGLYMSNRTNVEIRNGTIRNFAANGVRDGGVSGRGHRIINVRVIDNGYVAANAGIFLLSKNNIIKGCTVAGSGGYGIYCAEGSMIVGNSCRENGRSGIFAKDNAVILNNVSASNDNNGIYAYSGCTVIGNVVFDNYYWGIFLNGASLVDNNSVTNNNRVGTGYGNINGSSGSIMGANLAP